jgi:hypothetical protein
MFDRQKGLYRSPEGAPGGTGATPEPSAAAAAAGASGQPPAAGSGDGAAAFDWSKQGLDNDAMALVNDRQWKGIPDVLSSYRNLEKLTGVPPERILKLPGANDPVESWGAVYDRLGRPKAATDYKIPLPEGDTGEFAKVIAPIFHEAGLSQGQVQQIAEKHNAFIAEQTKQATEAAKTAHAAEMTATPNRVGRRLSKEQRCRGSRRGEFRDDKRPGILALKQAMGPSAAMKFLHNIGSQNCGGRVLRGRRQRRGLGFRCDESANGDREDRSEPHRSHLRRKVQQQRSRRTRASPRRDGTLAPDRLPWRSGRAGPRLASDPLFLETLPVMSRERFSLCAPIDTVQKACSMKNTIVGN